MFINWEIHFWEMSPEFQNAEDKHCDNLPPSFDDVLYYDCMMLFFGL
jgi:hypothetical protein